MGIIEITLALLAAVTVLCWVSARLRLPYPIVLVLAGLGIAMFGRLPPIELHPDLVLLLFLPPLLYRAATTTDFSQFKRDIAAISLLAVGLVLVTMVLVAMVAHWVIGLPWAVAFVLGAIVSPTDALAATVIMRRLAAPRKLSAIIEGESLVNDAGALVAYRMAIAAVVAGTFSLWEAGVAFFVDSIGGIAIGLAVGWIVMKLRARITDISIFQTGALLTPFAAYIPAEALNLSGVLAVVTCGLFIGVKGRPRAEVHIVVTPMWQAVEFILNGLGFILIGLQLPFAVDGLGHIPDATLVGWAVLVAATTIAARALWVFAGMLIRLRNPRGVPAPLRTRVAGAVVLSWSGMRGLVSLATALAVPQTIAGGAEFPHRHLIIFITFGVILITLIGQGLTLPFVMRWLRVTADHDADEETLARLEAAQAALARLEHLSQDAQTPAHLVAAVHKRYTDLVAQLRHAVKEHDRYFDSPLAGQYIAVRREAILASRQRLKQMLNAEQLDAELWSRLMWELDLEESTLSGFDLPAVPVPLEEAHVERSG